MVINVRIAKLEDANGITSVYCSDIKKWFKVVNNEKIEASYKELSIMERWAHGGPWMSAETCAIQINYLLIHNQFPLVAEINGEIVGELELYVGEEKGVLGKNAFIDVLEVHKQHRGKGIGKKLVEKAIEVAVNNGCETIAVWPAKEVVAFYKKCGLEDVAYNIKAVEIDLNDLGRESAEFKSHIDEIPRTYHEYKNLILITRRIFTSHALLLKQRFKFIIERYRFKIISGYIEDLQTIFIIRNTWESETTGVLDLWIRDLQDLQVVLMEVSKNAYREGFKKLILYVDENVFENHIKPMHHRVIGEEVLLFKKLINA